MEVTRMGIDYNKHPIVLFDSECSLCVRFKDSVKRIDTQKTLNFISIYDEQIYQIYPSLNKDKCLKEIHLIGNESEIYSGAQAIEYMIKNLPEIKKFSWLIENKMGQKAISLFHDTTNLLRRKLLNRCPSCNHK